MPTARLRVLIADDHAPMRAALRRDLEDGGIDVVERPEQAPRPLTRR